jgi:hypothetical protein
MGLSLPDVEDRIRHLSYEVGCIFSRKGVLLYAKAGYRHELTWTDDEIAILSHRVVTHNHPERDSFSPSDLALAWQYRIEQLRAVTSSRTYVVDEPPGGWRAFSWEEIATCASAQVAQVEEEIIAGLVPRRQLMHETWARALPKIGIPYTEL